MSRPKFRIRESTQKLLLDTLTTPKTFSEIASETGLSYQSARRHVLELQSMGFVYELGKRSPTGALLFQRTSSHNEQGIIVYWRGEYKPVGSAVYELVKGFRPVNYTRVLSGYLAYLFTRSFYKAQNEGKEAMHPDRAAEGSIEPIVIKERVRAALELLKDMVSLIEQCLLEDQLWTDSEKVAQRMAPVEEQINLLISAGVEIMQREDGLRDGQGAIDE